MKHSIIFVAIAVLSIMTIACSNDSKYEQEPQKDIHEENSVVENLSANLLSLPYEGNTASSRFDIDGGEMEILVKLVIADVYGYISCESNSVECKIVNALKCSVAMVEEILRETVDVVASNETQFCITSYTKEVNPNLNELIMATRTMPYLSDSIGYFHNYVISNSSATFNLSIVKDIQYTASVMNPYIPERLYSIPDDVVTTNLLGYIRNTIPQIYETDDVSDLLDYMGNIHNTDASVNTLYKSFFLPLVANNGLNNKDNYVLAISQIRASSLPDNSKNTLIDALALTYASAELWDMSDIFTNN